MEKQFKEKDHKKLILLILLIILLISVVIYFNVMHSKKEDEKAVGGMIRISYDRKEIKAMIEELESAQGLQIFIMNEATDEEVENIGKQIKKIEGVGSVTFVSREDAYNQMKERLKDREDVMEGIEPEIFSPSYTITLTDLNLVSKVQSSIYKLDNIKKITSSYETINALNSFTKDTNIYVTEKELKKALKEDGITLKQFESMEYYRKIEYLLEKGIEIIKEEDL